MKKYLIVFTTILFLFPFITFASAFNQNLYYGLTSSTDVMALQEFLTNQGYYTGPVSGNFFSLTLAGVKKFQGANNLPTSGYFGILSRGVANNLLASEMNVPSQESGIVLPVSNTANQRNYSTYSTVTLSQYSENPAAYLGQNITVEG